MTLELTEPLLNAMAPNEVALDDARGLLQRGAFRGLCRSHDGVFVMGDCYGTSKTPYRVAIDLGAGEKPLAYCTCPSRSNPCKHALALMLGYAGKPELFARVEPPQELLDKRAKQAERLSRPSSEPRPRVNNAQAAQRKADEQRAALETLERFLVDVVSQGLGGAHARTLTAIEAQASRMGDADLTGARGLLVRLAAVLRASMAKSGASMRDEDDDAGHGGAAIELYAAMDPDARNGLAVGLLTQLWVTVRKGRKALEGDAKESDAQVESLLGRKWQLPQLKEAGHWTLDRTLMELAHERYDDVVSETILTTGWMLDLGSGAVHMERTLIPYKALHATDVKHRVPREGVLSVREAALYPGETVNRRIRWNERDATVCTERPCGADDYAKLHALARPVEAVMKQWREVLKSPLGARECVALLDAKGFELRGARLVMLDGASGRITFGDPPAAQCVTTPTLVHAAGAHRSGSIAARLWLDATTHAVKAQALAMFAGSTHLRLGM